MLEGRRESERITASPRKMCVPGVQAWATDGVSITSSNAASNTVPTEAARDAARDIPRALDADALTLPAYCFPEIGQLFFHYVVDRVPRGVDVFADLFHHVVDGNAVDQLSAALDCGAKPSLRARRRPARAFCRAITGPPSSVESAAAGPLRAFEASHARERRATPGVAHQWTHRSTPRRAASQQQGDTGSDGSADQGGRQQVVLLLTLIVTFHLWV